MVQNCIKFINKDITHELSDARSKGFLNVNLIYLIINIAEKVSITWVLWVIIR
mgnify:CR=1 FL=1